MMFGWIFAALWGVNYYAPFSLDYNCLAEQGADIRAEMRKDVAHFRRLNVNLLRVHCFDRQISDVEGRFIDNEHVALLDELISLCASNGIQTVLTPIAWWWCGSRPEDQTGFSARHDMRTLTRERDLWPVQARYLGEFASHTNRFTGFRYADDPCIHAFELINEPLYDKDYPDGKLTEYVNALAAGLRSSGTKKPVFFNSWYGRNAAVSKAAVDGVTGNLYPTGLLNKEELEGFQLGRIDRSTLHPEDLPPGLRRMIYEFDAADTPGAYLYPAFARLFRHEGVEAAAMFQYDPLAVAPRNDNWQTHYLNLVYTPAKALSFLIGGEAFRMLPEGCPFETNATRMVFGPFLVDAARNLSQMATETSYLYSSDPVTPPPAPQKLERVYGCGKSSVASSTGTGAYFLDRLAPGKWRLQLYPTVFRIENPYRGGKSRKTVAVGAKPSFTVDLPDLGPRTTWRLAPGDYLLEAKDRRVECSPFSGEDEPRFVVPAYDPPRPYAYLKTIESQYRRGRAFEVRTEFAGTNALDLVFTAADGTRKTLAAMRPLTTVPGNFLGSGIWNLSLLDRPASGEAAALDGRLEIVDDWRKWNLFDVRRAVWRKTWLPTGGWACGVKGPDGGPAYRLSARNLVDSETMSAGERIDPRRFREQFPDAPCPTEFTLKCRRGEPCTEKVEIAFILSNGQPWGCNIELPRDWGEVRVPVSNLRFFSHWNLKCAYAEGDRPDLRDVREIRFCFGRWIVPEAAWGLRHAVEVESVCLSASKEGKD